MESRKVRLAKIARGPRKGQQVASYLLRHRRDRTTHCRKRRTSTVSRPSSRPRVPSAFFPRQSHSSVAGSMLFTSSPKVPDRNSISTPFRRFSHSRNGCLAFLQLSIDAHYPRHLFRSKAHFISYNPRLLYPSLCFPLSRTPCPTCLWTRIQNR